MKGGGTGEESGVYQVPKAVCGARVALLASAGNARKAGDRVEVRGGPGGPTGAFPSPRAVQSARVSQWTAGQLGPRCGGARGRSGGSNGYILLALRIMFDILEGELSVVCPASESARATGKAGAAGLESARLSGTRVSAGRVKAPGGDGGRRSGKALGLQK